MGCSDIMRTFCSIEVDDGGDLLLLINHLRGHAEETDFSCFGNDSALSSYSNVYNMDSSCVQVIVETP